jgi:GMP synthase-like glutamine amidotransferase
MKRAIVLQHMNHDFPGRFLDYFAEENLVPDFVRLFEGQTIPSLVGYDFMFVLGGSQDVWQEDIHPWLKEEKAAIREWVKDRAKPYFGVCLGHQLLCEAMGGHVAPAEQGEVGVYDVTLTAEGHGHPLFQGLNPVHKVIQWHHAEVKRVPEGAKVLATSQLIPVQALAVGTHALSTQFHIEFSAQSIATWSSLPRYGEVLDEHLGKGGYMKLVRDSYPHMPDMAAMARQMWDNLLLGSKFST